MAQSKSLLDVLLDEAAGELDQIAMLQSFIADHNNMAATMQKMSDKFGGSFYLNQKRKHEEWAAEFQKYLVMIRDSATYYSGK